MGHIRHITQPTVYAVNQESYPFNSTTANLALNTNVGYVYLNLSMPPIESSMLFVRYGSNSLFRKSQAAELLRRLRILYFINVER